MTIKNSGSTVLNFFVTKQDVLNFTQKNKIIGIKIGDLPWYRTQRGPSLARSWPPTEAGGCSQGSTSSLPAA